MASSAPSGIVLFVLYFDQPVALDQDMGRVMLVQLAGCWSYVKTLCRMHIHMPSPILVGAAPAIDWVMTSTKLSIFPDYAQEEFSGTLVEPGARKCWNDGRGIELIHQLCVYEDARAGTILVASDKYYAIPAVCALFKCLKRCLDTLFSAHSLLIRYVPVEHEDDRPRDCVQLRLWAAIHARLGVVKQLVKSEDLIKEVREAPRALGYVDSDKLAASCAPAVYVALFPSTLTPNSTHSQTQTLLGPEILGGRPSLAGYEDLFDPQTYADIDVQSGQKLLSCVEEQEADIRNNSCVFAPEVTQGAYYHSEAHLIWQNIPELQFSVLTLLDVGVINVETCLPFPNALVDMWHANATGDGGDKEGVEDGAPKVGGV
ncbi:hypothetical protein FIBSPDRAFT_951949 [Athelia psychrophila]|uniref:Uncharacterized protein n=1 Tax=Athelia psychrophila TaxID=1759441 RepID=A0A166LX59_9AGAM|nr:hypothetical protein FIBSPDRAFT_951949 [Fibularhizoctonia sp. CBS 109695]